MPTLENRRAIMICGLSCLITHAFAAAGDPANVAPNPSFELDAKRLGGWLPVGVETTNGAVRAVAVVPPATTLSTVLGTARPASPAAGNTPRLLPHEIKLAPDSAQEPARRLAVPDVAPHSPPQTLRNERAATASHPP
jgi:hypothetical protein